jgi:hypothetical protein
VPEVSQIVGRTMAMKCPRTPVGWGSAHFGGMALGTAAAARIYSARVLRLKPHLDAADSWRKVRVSRSRTR